jgi:hypothetical protein
VGTGQFDALRTDSPQAALLFLDYS